MDADFAAYFIKLLHIQGTKGFWTLQCYDKLFGEQVGSIVFCCTQNEVRNYGNFVSYSSDYI
jgi:THO complex subunit 2